MREAPSGTVTFLFTDIEGSTRLWERDREAMRDALALHDAILREETERHHGSVFKTVGDAFCVAFVRPDEALAAAVAAQRRLRASQWSEALGPLRVRMGIHTGTAVESGGDYIGPTLNRVARLMSIGHGEQILVSSTSALLLRDMLPAGTTLRDLGSHLLKGLSHPETAFQVVADGLRTEFPALRSTGEPPSASAKLHNLPLLLTTLYGRDNELDALSRELRDHRLVTLAGFGGVGKTRMAIEAGWHLLDEFPDGVVLVELAPIADPGLVSARVAAAFNIPAQTGQLSGELWLDALREKHALLVLDNCEHVLDAAGELVHRVLQRCPSVHVLATSREPLRVPGERVLRIEPLAVPPPSNNGATVAAIRNAPAVLMFLDRVSNVAPEFAPADNEAATWKALGEICTRLDGIPLAIELAAARVPTLGLAHVSRGLDDRFKLLTRGARTSAPRQQTLQATLDWSYDALTAAEQRVFNRLGVFAGSFTADAAAAVCAGDETFAPDVLDALASLVDKSLVLADRSQQSLRYRLLETTRAYALTQLRLHADSDAAQRRHAMHYHELSLEARAMFGATRLAQWFTRYEPDVDNFRAALAWSIEQRGDVLLGAAILCNLKRVLEWESLNAEALSWCRRALAALGGDAPPAIEAELEIVATRSHFALGEWHAAIAPAQRAVDLLRGLDAKVPLAFALTLLARALASQPDQHDAASAVLAEALAIYDAAEAGEIDAHSDEGDLARRLTHTLAYSYKAFLADPSDIEGRRDVLTRALSRFTELAPDYFIVGVVLELLSELELDARNYTAARDRALESIDFYRHTTSSFGYLFSLNAAATATLACRDVESARAYAADLLSRVRRMGSAPGLGMALLVFAAIEALNGDAVRAAGLLGAWKTCPGMIDTPIPTTTFLCARAQDALAQRLDAATIGTAVAAGERWSVETAIEAASAVAERRAAGDDPVAVQPTR